MSLNLNAVAQEEADYLLFKLNKTLQHNINAYVSEDNHINGDQVCRAWYCKEALSYSHLSDRLASYHFTQMVWRASTHVGFGFANSSNFSIVTAQYNPGGNIVGNYRSNVVVKRPRALPGFCENSALSVLPSIHISVALLLTYYLLI
ncbi:hypothetical protein GJ496_006819 [Pomphorhynchus laevis]|nr:hypothetical protein GJ496_006819 [Pomphorhynchus laevis]